MYLGAWQKGGWPGSARGMFSQSLRMALYGARKLMRHLPSAPHHLRDSARALNSPELIYRSSARYDLRFQEDANNISLFIHWVFGLQDHNPYLLDCLFWVMNVFFTTPVNVPRPKLQARRVPHMWKFYGNRTEWSWDLKHIPVESPQLCSFSHSPVPSVIHP